MVIKRTKAVEIRIHAVSPESILGVAAGAGVAVAAEGASAEPVTGASVVVATTVVVSSVAGADAAFSAHAAEPPKSAPDRLSAKSIFSFVSPNLNFYELFVLSKLYANT